MATYLSNFRNGKKITVDGVVGGQITIDTLPASSYKTMRYEFVAEDSVTGALMDGSFVVAHDSLEISLTEVSFVGDADITFDVEYGVIVDGYPTTLNVKASFPVGFDGTYTFSREVFINTEQIQKIGSDGPSGYLYPSQFLYPNS